MGAASGFASVRPTVQADSQTNRATGLIGPLQFQPAKQLSIRGHDDGGEAHCDCTHTHRQVNPLANEKTSCDRDSDKVITSRGSLRTSTIPADSIATSVPAPIAIPTSAVASAGASFTPSPTMATFLPPA